MSTARPYKKSERENALERDAAELEKEVIETKQTPHPDTVAPPKTESETKEEPKKKDEDKEKLEDVKTDDRYKLRSADD